jgi:hypothetical protein
VIPNEVSETGFSRPVLCQRSCPVDVISAVTAMLTDCKKRLRGRRSQNRAPLSTQKLGKIDISVFSTFDGTLHGYQRKVTSSAFVEHRSTSNDLFPEAGSISPSIIPR